VINAQKLELGKLHLKNEMGKKVTKMNLWTCRKKWSNDHVTKEAMKCKKSHH
jgi:hypothetical protein